MQYMENYEISEYTYAIIGKDLKNSRIIEKEKEYDVSQSAYEVMDSNCKYYGSSYKGRLEAGKEILECSYKIPILMEETNNLIFFPIKSSLSEDCCWINLNSIKKVEKSGNNAIIKFKNDKELLVNSSKMSINNQIYKSTKLESIINKRINAKKEE